MGSGSVRDVAVSDHGARRFAPLDLDEADRFVEATRRVFVVDAETQCLVSLGNAGPNEFCEESAADPLPAA